MGTVWGLFGDCAGTVQARATALSGHVGKLSGRQVGRSTAVAAVGKLASRQFGRSAGPQGGRSAGRQVDRAARERVGKSAGRHVSRSASRQACRLTSRQAAWYAGCQVDKSLDPLTNPHPRSHQNPSRFHSRELFLEMHSCSPSNICRMWPTTAGSRLLPQEPGWRSGCLLNFSGLFTKRRFVEKALAFFDF